MPQSVAHNLLAGSSHNSARYRCRVTPDSPHDSSMGSGSQPTGPTEGEAGATEERGIFADVERSVRLHNVCPHQGRSHRPSFKGEGQFPRNEMSGSGTRMFEAGSRRWPFRQEEKGTHVRARDRRLPDHRSTIRCMTDPPSPRPRLENTYQLI